MTLPPAWAHAPLEDLVEILDSQRIPVNRDERSQRPGSFPYYGATGQVGWIDGFIFEGEHLLLGEDGAPFLDSTKPKAYLVRGKFWVNNHAHVLKARPGINISFLLHQLNVVGYREFVSGTTRLKLPQAPMRMIPLRVAPEGEQERIVEEVERHLTRLEAAVASLQRVQANLKRYRAAVLKAACEGRLVPTEAELARVEGRGYEPGDLLLRRTLAERRQRWQLKLGRVGNGRYEEPPSPKVSDSLPEGWAWTTFEQTSERVTVGHVGRMKDEYAASGVPFLRSQNVRENRFEPEGLRFISPEFHAQLGKSLIKPGDIAIVRSGSVGVACVIPEHLGEANCADLVIIQAPIGLQPEFGAFYMNSLAKKLVLRGRVGIALAHFNTKSVAELPVPLPPLAEQQRIVLEVNKHLSIIDEMERLLEANLLRSFQTRTLILKRAFQGRLVAQDANDEPASVLLERIRQAKASQPAKPRARKERAKPARAEEPPPPAEPEPEPQEADFLELSRDEQVDLAWETLLGQGTLDKDAAIRTVADGLRDLDLARFKRLRQDGPLYGAIAAAIEKGVREGDFDRPRRGCVRAVLPDPKDYTDEVWQRCLLAVTGPEPADLDATLRAAAEWARDAMGLDYARLRKDGAILTGLRKALEMEVRAGRIVRQKGKIRQVS